MNAAFAAAENDQAKLNELSQASQAQLDAFAAQEAAADQTKLDSIMAIFQGLALQNKDGADAMREAGGLIQTMDTLMQLTGTYSDKVNALQSMMTMPGMDWLTAGTNWDAVQKLGGDGLLAADPQLATQMVADFVAELQSKLGTKINELMSTEGVSPITSALQAMMDNASIGELDVTKVSGVLADALRVSLVAKDGVEGLESDMMQSIGSAITEHADLAADPAAEAAARVNAELSAAAVNTGTWTAQVQGIGDAIVKAGQSAILRAMAVRTNLMSVLSGMDVQLPGSGVLSAGGGSALTPGARVYNSNMTFNMGGVTLPNGTSVKAFRDELSGLQQRDRAGLGWLE